MPFTRKAGGSWGEELGEEEEEGGPRFSWTGVAHSSCESFLLALLKKEGNFHNPPNFEVGDR